MNHPLRIALAGFRHIHIFDLYQRVIEHPQLRLVATCEEHFDDSLMAAKGLKPTHKNFDEMLASVDCDIVALGDCYGRRGSQAIRALRAGKHIIADKPLCTSSAELDEIESLSREKNLCVGLMFDLRDHGNFIALREVIRSGRIGEVQTVSFSAQHPLLWGRRPSWYFDPGMHGGTLNDIAIHAIDFIPWVTGLGIQEITAARSWNAKAKEAPHFKDCGQVALRLSNGGGVLGDVSYLAPDSCGYTIDNYWRITVHGTQGFAETSYNRSGVTVADDSSTVPDLMPPAPARPGGYLQDFLDDIAGVPSREGLRTKTNLHTTRLAINLETQANFS